MDDPTKPVQPLSAGSIGQSGGPPKNLPTIAGQTLPSAPTPPPAGQFSPQKHSEPSPPASPNPSSQPPIMPPQPPQAPKPPATSSSPPLPTGPQAPAGGPAPVIHSSIRTMQQDIEDLNKGGKLSGIPVEHQTQGPLAVKPEPEKKAAVAPQAPARPNVQLGTPEKSKPIIPPPLPPPSKPTPPSPPPPIKPISVPPVGSGKPFFANPLLYIIVLLAGAIGFLVWYLYLQPADEVAVVETPTVEPTLFPTSTPVPVPLKAVISQDSDMAQQLRSFALETKPNPQQLKIADIVSDTGQAMTFTDIVKGLNLTPPASLTSQIGISPVRLLIHGDPSGTAVGLIIDIPFNALLADGMKSWETKLPQNLSKLFSINPALAQTKLFQETNRSAVVVRYRNFPNPSGTVDYGTVIKDQLRYLIVTSSRESMFAAVDTFSLRTTVLSGEEPAPTSGAFPGAQTTETPVPGK